MKRTHFLLAGLATTAALLLPACTSMPSQDAGDTLKSTLQSMGGAGLKTLRYQKSL
jgi:starvation-inducible outer membrane lipoprotein